MAGESGYQSDPDFLAILPNCIASAEDRILRDLDLLSTHVIDNTGSLTPNSKIFVLPTATGTFIVTEQLRILPPSTETFGSFDFGQPLLGVTKDTLDALWPSEQAPSSPSIPTMWAPNDQKSVFVGPPPSQAYLVSTYGTMRPLPLSPQMTNGTFISTQMKDLFLAAELIFISGWERMEDPQAVGYWLTEYERLKTPALIEESRKRLQSIGFSPRLPSPPVDTPPMPRSGG